jgi:hypothetical protein
MLLGTVTSGHEALKCLEPLSERDRLTLCQAFGLRNRLESLVVECCSRMLLLEPYIPQYAVNYIYIYSGIWPFEQGLTDIRSIFLFVLTSAWLKWSTSTMTLGNLLKILCC